MPKPSRKHAVATISELPVGGRKLVEVDGRSIGIFNVNGDFVAVLNVCPHQLAPVCKGRLSGTTLLSAPAEFSWGREGEILACPWHGWEFDLRTGQAVADGKTRLRLFPVSVEDETIYVEL